MSAYDHNLNPTFSSTLQTVYKRFQDEIQDADNPNQAVLLQQNELNFLGVSTNSTAHFDVHHFRRAIGDLLRLDNLRTVQVVGDSGIGFTPKGYQRAVQVIHSMVLDDHGNVREDTMLEYGYTATEHDTNWIVNEILATTPKLRAQTLGNIVHMSSVAVDIWGCEATGNVRNFVLAYDHKGETAFGSDTWLSDSIMSSSTGDVMVCLEGGPQAFAQAVNVLLQGVAVIVVTGPGMRVPAAQDRFSAARMLEFLREEIQIYVDKERITPIEKMRIQSEALRYLEGHEDCRPPANQSRYETVERALSKLMTSPESLRTLQIEHVS